MNEGDISKILNALRPGVEARILSNQRRDEARLKLIRDKDQARRSTVKSENKEETPPEVDDQSYAYWTE